MNIEELKNLKLSIEKETINLEDEKEQIYKYKNKKSWMTKEWKENREYYIKDKCEQCNSTENLYIQHTWHPRSYGIIRQPISQKYGEMLREKYVIEDIVNEDEILEYININYEYIDRKSCPFCESVNIVEQKTLNPKYKCNKCKKRFENFKNIKFLVPKNSYTFSKKTYEEIKSSVKKKIYKEKISKIKEELYQNDIEKETLLELIDDNIRYLSMKDTKTYCKKCAFLEDVRGLNLCPICKRKYKKIEYDMCYECKFGLEYKGSGKC